MNGAAWAAWLRLLPRAALDAFIVEHARKATELHRREDREEAQAMAQAAQDEADRRDRSGEVSP